jgi:putative ABC transport system substrate-binding protein
LSNPRNPDSKLSVQEVEAAASDLGIKVKVYEASDPSQFSNAFKAMSADRAGAGMVLTDPMFLTYRKQLVDLAAQSRLPTMYPISEYATVGGLMFYGANFPEMYRRAAALVDKILKGSKPAELPVEQATKFELVINLRAAKQIGLTIPPNVLARADRVIR